MLSETEANSMLPIVNRYLRGESVDLSIFVSKEVVYGFKSDDKTNPKSVAVIPIKNVIVKYDYCGNMGMLSFENILKQFLNDSTIGAVVLDMDSGGGEASYMHNVAQTLQSFRAAKPILGYFSGVCGSACYYIGSQTTKLYASSPTDLVGSIGTMVNLKRPNPENKTAEYITESIYATKSTAKNQEFEQALKGNPETLIKNLLDPFNEQFMNDVLIGRPAINKDALDGRAINSSKAIDLYMIDGIKNFESVIEEAFSLIQ